jgi:aspartate carbamoyltransferase catalytic subunit
MNKQEILQFIKHVDQMKNPLRQYPNRTVVHYFREHTRSYYSFQAAALKLGCNVMSVDQTLSESLEDSVKILQHYGDAIVIRHPDSDAHSRAVKISRVPVIQAGSHCQNTQALIDIYTLFKELKYRGIDLDSDKRPILNVTFLGYNRAIQAFIALLSLFPRIKYHYVSDEIPSTDVLYVSRRQNDESYCVDKEFLSKTKPTMIVMHPLPRSDELSHTIDTNPRSVYFQQSENGLYVRMALLDAIFSVRQYPTLYELFWIYMAKLASIFSA